MVMLKNPDMPATKSQLWLLHILTKTDTRDLKITMAEASKRITELKSNPKKSVVVDKKPIEKSNPVERVVIQGKKPTGQTDMVKIQADFELNGKPLAVAKLKKENCYSDDIRIDFYDFNCKECLFGQCGVCTPKWSESGYTTCAGKVENVNFRCDHFESTEHSISEYCYRPHGKQCHRKSIDNHCLECQYRSGKFRLDYGNNRTAWYRWIPTMQERLDYYNHQLERWENPPEHYSDIDYKGAIQNTKEIIELLNKIRE